MEVQGIIKVIGETKSFGENGFRKRDLVVTTTEEKYPQTLNIEFFQDKVRLLDDVQVGQNVNIGINLTGREWTKDGVTRYFNSIKGWRIDPVGGVQQRGSEVSSSNFSPDRDDDDLPF